MLRDSSCKQLCRAPLYIRAVIYVSMFGVGVLDLLWSIYATFGEPVKEFVKALFL